MSGPAYQIGVLEVSRLSPIFFVRPLYTVLTGRMSLVGFTSAKKDRCFQNAGSNVSSSSKPASNLRTSPVQDLNLILLALSTFQLPSSAFTVGYWLVKSVSITGTGVFLILHSALPP